MIVLISGLLASVAVGFGIDHYHRRAAQRRQLEVLGR